MSQNTHAEGCGVIVDQYGPMTAPRLSPLPIDSIDPELRPVLDAGLRGPDGSPLNIFATLARHPKLFKRWMVFATHVLSKNSLSARHRELLILRTGLRCNSPYEWGQHVPIGLRSQLDQDDIDAIAHWPATDRFSPLEQALLRAADELHDDSVIGNDTWRRLQEGLDEQQVIDVIFTVGNYHVVAFFLNSAGVQLDEGIPDTMPR